MSSSPKTNELGAYSGQQQKEATGVWGGEGELVLTVEGGLTSSFPLQLDISGKLYLAPLTTVGGGWGWVAQCFPGALLVQYLCFTDL